MHTSVSQKASEALAEIGACCAWHIHHSSEGCTIEISGVPVVLSRESVSSIKEYFRSDQNKTVPDLSDCILMAADAWELDCYPERGRRWLEVTK